MDIHLMSAPEGNGWFFFPESLNVYVPTKVIRYAISVLFEDLFFHKTNKQISKVGTHFSFRSYTTYLFLQHHERKIVEGNH